MDTPTKDQDWTRWQDWDTLTLHTHDAHPEIGRLTLNRPQQLNAINHAMIEDLHDCLGMLNQAFDCRVLLLCGAGRLFCAGTDLGSGDNDREIDFTKFPDQVKIFYHVQRAISRVIHQLRRIPQPVVCAVHGAAAGGGMALANASDIVLATRETKFINAFIKIGLSGADCGSSYFLPRTIGFHRSAELLYSGRDLFAEEAHQWGYVNILVDQTEELMPQAIAFAVDRMLTKSPLGLRLTKEALNANMDAPGLDAAIQLEDRNQTIAGQSADFAEGVGAFFGKRKPQYGSR